MEILQRDDESKGTFYVEEKSKKLAEMTYVWTGTTRIIIDHTEVNETLKGKGIGKQLVTKAVNFAREKSIKIIPLCSIAKSWFNRVSP
jgi:predicted GNAT family acetyltransferase